MTVDDKVATLHEFHEWRQDKGLASTHWDSAVGLYEAYLRAEEREAIVDELRRLAGDHTPEGVARVNELLDQLA